MVLLGLTGSLRAQEIALSNRTATITTLQGRVYTNVTLIKATRDGIIWSGGGMGLISYTNLTPSFLESLGVPTNRIEEVKAREAQKAAAKAERREQAMAKAYAESLALGEPAPDKNVELVRITALLSAGRYKQCATARGEMVLIQLLPASLEAILNNLGQQAAQIEYLRSWVDNGGRVIRHAEAVAHDANMANLNNPYAPTYYVKESDYASLADAQDDLNRLQLEQVRYLAETKAARAVTLKRVGTYGTSPVWQCAEAGR